MTGKKLVMIVVVFGLVGLSSMKGQIPTWQWAKQGLGTAIGDGVGSNITSDIFGNIYMTGNCNGSISFDTFTFVNSWASPYLVKYNTSGNVIWAKCSHNGPGGNAGSLGIATDLNGNIFITGCFSHTTITFDTITLTSAGENDIFLIKYDSSGNILWAKVMGGTMEDEGTSVKTDAIGNCYLTGSFGSPYLIFGSDTLFNFGIMDIFLTKFDPQGNPIWAKNAGGSEWDVSNSISIDGFGNLYITGETGSPIAYFGNDSFVRPSNIPSYFLAKYDTSGNFHWVISTNGDAGAEGKNVANDLQGNIYATGYYQGFFNSTDIVFGIDTLLVSGTQKNAFIVKYDSSGNALWAKNSLGSGYGLAPDNLGNVFVTVGMQDTIVSFDTMVFYPPAGSLEPMFIAMCDQSGHAIFGYVLASSGGEAGSAVTIDHSGSIYLCGYFTHVNPFIVGNDSLIFNGIGNPFIAKLADIRLETNTKNNKFKQTLLLSPNPFTTTTTLTLQGTCHNPSLFIYNLLGQVVGAQNFVPLQGTNTQFIIHRNNLPAGMYFYKVMDENKEVIGIGKMVVE